MMPGGREKPELAGFKPVRYDGLMRNGSPGRKPEKTRGIPGVGESLRRERWCGFNGANWAVPPGFWVGTSEWSLQLIDIL